VIVVAIEKRDLNGSVREASRGPEATEARADDDNARACHLTHPGP